MELVRHKAFVEAFHYDAHNGEQGENEIKVDVTPLEVNEEADFDSEKNSILGVRVIYKIMFPDFVLTGAVRQLVEVHGRKITASEELSKEEVNELIKPLFRVVERLTEEVTEIALDIPGVKLNFQQED
ncbi:DUF1149 family protein [Vagococcus xieshaowenii]|uniref:DUF1149 family protein n=1 Tax=Vagococcus xieshaowenii TaxID=2562451 RepID=A0AAJ5EFG5_9ENTE|nr:DUF1149 family protein [Vagococcus xieshaowenii]QCA29061.1 DUF1149 family protein [Vagococcus xieshaowenii]TFZ40963.1 DUF1149 family protein [Vagococcus xieshaowenii]